MQKPRDLFCLEECVLSKKNNNLYIYNIKSKTDVSTWELVETLKSHLIYVSSVDWHPETNRIISSSHDRNILVWQFNQTRQAWMPELVNLQVKLAILEVKWSQRGDKFLATTGSKLLATGYYDEETNMWSCKTMKEHRSSITTARFDGTGLFILSGSTDSNAIISSAYMPELDDKFSYESLPFPKENFGDVIIQNSLSAWVNCVAWTPNNQYSFIATHDAYLHVINSSDKSTVSIPLSHSPFSHIIVPNNTNLFGIGFDRHLYQYTFDQTSGWRFLKSLTKDHISNPEGVASSFVDVVKDNPLIQGSRNSGVVSGGIQDRLSTFQAGSRASVSGGIQDRLSTFQAGAKPKLSIKVTSTVQTNIHSANVNSVNFIENHLVTSDYAGFIKTWSI